ncbi:MAG: site-specific DNA-methyltransferase [Thermoleophilia bacterium]
MSEYLPQTLAGDPVGLLEIQRWPIDKVVPYAQNPRTHSPASVAKIAASLRQFGWRQSLVVDEEGVLIIGHGRLFAAEQLGLTQVPVHVALGLTAAQVKALRLADNRIADESSWNEELLAIEIEGLLAIDVDLAMTGFDAKDMAAILPVSEFAAEAPLPEPPAEPVTKPGDLWLLGKHRLLCGDSTDTEQVQRLMNGERAVLMATDPPYLVDYDGGNHPQTWGNGGKEAGHDVATKHWDAYTDHDSAVTFYQRFLAAALAEALTERPLIYQWFGMMRIDVVLEAWKANKLLPHQVIIWHKSRPVLTRCDFMWNYELCLYGWIEGMRPDSGMRPPADAKAVWEVASAIEDNPGSVHPTMKPVELIRRPIEWHTRPGELIYEPFSGSGTAIIAAEQTRRRCFAIELSPAFVDVAVQRWERLTGKTAVLST